MKRRGTALVLAVVVLLSALMLSGCFNEMLYGTWRLSYTADEYGKNRSNYPLAITMELTSNGDVYMIAGTQRSLFGTFVRNKNLFTLTPLDGTSEVITGSWIIVEGSEATELQLFPDDKPMSYILQRTIAGTAE